MCSGVWRIETAPAYWTDVPDSARLSCNKRETLTATRNNITVNEQARTRPLQLKQVDDQVFLFLVTVTIFHLVAMQAMEGRIEEL